MKLLTVVLVSAALGWGQYTTVPSSSYPTLDGILNAKLAFQVGTGAPSGSCTAGKDVFADTASTPHVLYWCDASGHWVALIDAAGNYANPSWIASLAWSKLTGVPSFESVLTFTSPLSRSVNAISIPAAASGVSGYLTAADWAAFTAKQSALNAAGVVAMFGGGSCSGYLKSDGTCATPGGSGDASTNTSTSVVGEIALFADTTGKLFKRATGSGIAKLTSGVLGTATAGTDYSAPGTAQTTTATRTMNAFLDVSGGSLRAPEATVATLPAASGVTGRVYLITDGASFASCATGGGTFKTICRSNGTTYDAIAAGGAAPYSCAVSTTGTASATCTHNLGTSQPWVSCYDGSGNMLGSSGASTSVTSVVATSASVATLTFSGSTTATCLISTGSMGPQGPTGSAGANGASGPPNSCIVVFGDPGAATSALAADNDSPNVCGNLSGANLTISSVGCITNAGSVTVLPILTGGSSTSILSSALTCTTSWSGAAANGSPVLHAFSNAYTCSSTPCTIDANISTVDGTAKYVVVQVKF